MRNQKFQRLAASAARPILPSAKSTALPDPFRAEVEPRYSLLGGRLGFHNYEASLGWAFADLERGNAWFSPRGLPGHRSSQLRVGPHRALPDGHGAPSKLTALRKNLSVPPHIGVELVGPERRSRSRHSEVPAVLVCMPEAAVDENDGLPAGQHDVRATWKPLVGEAEPKTRPPEQLSKHHLRLRVRASNA